MTEDEQRPPASGDEHRRQLLEINRELNRSTEDMVESFAAHRSEVMQLVGAARPGSGGRLLVLGAGNCNDLDLGTAADWFAEVHLLDLDGEALDAAVVRQGVSDRAIVLHRGVDLLAPEPALPSGAFEVVLSACVLTQLFNDLVTFTPLEQINHRLLAERDRHLHHLVSCTAPGGRALLLTDVISSDMCPEMIDCPLWQLSDLLARAVESRNFFTGTNPKAIEVALQRDPTLGPRIVDLTLSHAWRWTRGEHHSLVYGMTLTLA